jgi:hypothetical protein
MPVTPTLQIAAVYQPDSDEVWVDFKALATDQVTVLVADRIVAKLKVASKDLNGTVTYRDLTEITTTKDYLQAEKNYLLKFRHPKRRKDLFLSIDALFGSDVFQKQVSVGEAASPYTEMQLPDNVLWEKDTFDEGVDLGDNPGFGENFPNNNQVVLEPKLLDYAQKFDFTLSQDPQVFESLLYQGGGNRLLMSNKNNSYLFQNLNQSPWGLSSYAFMEPQRQNLLPNPFFNAATQNTPNGYLVDSAGAILNQTLAPDYLTATGAKLWTLRFRQANMYSAFNQARVSLSAPISVSENQPYTFSIYTKVTPLSMTTEVNQFKLALAWKDSLGGIIQTDEEVLQTSNFSSLGLAQMQVQSPIGAVAVEPAFYLGSIDAGDDVQWVLFAPQLETGTHPTSRCSGSRAEDVIEIPNYTAANQKVRIEFIPGFDSGLSTVALTTGPLLLSLTAASKFRAEIPNYTTSNQVVFDSNNTSNAQPYLGTILYAKGALGVSIVDGTTVILTGTANGTISGGQYIVKDSLPGWFYLTDLNSQQVPFTGNGTGSFTLTFISGTAAIAEIPLVFSAGDVLDLTVQHQSGGFLSIYQSGDLAAQVPLPAIAVAPSPFLIRGFLGEILRLTVFSRK